ncbi:MAG: hypothetical protein R3D57_06295 [Hyphomicrobiaceae bacterium]
MASAVSFGVADFLGGRAAARLNPPLAVVLVQSVACAFVLLIVVVGSYPLPSGPGLTFSIVAGLADGIALILLYRGLAVGRISIVAPLTGVFSIAVPAVVEAVFVREIGSQIVAGIVLAAVAVVLIAHASSGGEGDKPLKPSVMLGLSGGLTFGVTNLFLGLLEPEQANGGVLVMRSGAVAMAALVAFFGPISAPRDRRGLVIGGAAGVLDALGMIGLVYSATVGLIGVAASINALYAGVTVVLGVLLLGERLGRVQLAGLALGGVAIMLLANGH